MLLGPEDLTSIKELSQCQDKSRQVDIPVSVNNKIMNIHVLVYGTFIN